MKNKKYGIWIALVGSAILLTGCTTQPDKDSVPKTSHAFKKSEHTPAVVTAQEVQVASHTYKRNDVVIHYPQVTGFKNKPIESKLNKTLKNQVVEYVANVTEPDSTIQLDYTIMLDSPTVLSVVYKGESMIAGGPYVQHLFLTTNLNKETGELQQLSDVVPVDVHFVTALKKATLVELEKNSTEDQQRALYDLLHGWNEKELLVGLTHADTLDIHENELGIYTYQTETSVVVSLTLPHAVGDHGEYEVRLDSLNKPLPAVSSAPASPSKSNVTVKPTAPRPSTSHTSTSPVSSLSPEENALALAKAYGTAHYSELQDEGNPYRYHVDHMEGAYYVIQISEYVDDHTNTLAWLGVNPESGKVVDAFNHPEEMK